MIRKLLFGKLNTGETAYRYLLENKCGTKIQVSDLGATVLSIVIKDKNNESKDVVLGFDNVDDYLNTDTGMGAYIGRNANRIKDASFFIKGVKYNLDKNDGKNNIHSGYNKSNCKVYAATRGEDSKGQYVEFYRVSPHLEQGFPGNLEQKIKYTLTNNNEFIIDYDMVSDKTTIVNPTNHAYYNLDGHDSGTVLNHKLEIYSDAFLKTDKELIPTGEIVDVTGTPMDFRQEKIIGKDIESEYLPLQYAGGYDHNYVFENDRVLKKVAKLKGEKSGIAMTVLSDLCGMQIYTGNFLNGEVGKNGAVYEKNSGICFETQFFPNACNEMTFPSPLLGAKKKFTSRTIYKFEINN